MSKENLGYGSVTYYGAEGEVRLLENFSDLSMYISTRSDFFSMQFNKILNAIFSAESEEQVKEAYVDFKLLCQKEVEQAHSEGTLENIADEDLKSITDAIMDLQNTSWNLSALFQKVIRSKEKKSIVRSDTKNYGFGPRGTLDLVLDDEDDDSLCSSDSGEYCKES